MPDDPYINEALLQEKISAAWNTGGPSQQIRMLEGLGLPLSLAGTELLPEQRVQFPEAAGRSLADRWGRPDFAFVGDGVAQAWVEVKLTASPGSLKLAAYALGLPDAQGRLLSPFWPGWETYPLNGAPPVRHVALGEFLAVLDPSDVLAAIARFLDDILEPSRVPETTSLTDLLAAMPGWWRAQDVASGAVLSSEMARVGLRPYIRVLGHWGLDADLLGSPAGELCDRTYFCASVWMPGAKTWVAAEMQFHRPKRQHGSLTGVHLFIVSGSEGAPVEPNPAWLAAGQALALDHGWMALGSTTTSPSSTATVSSSPSSRVTVRNEGLVFGADLDTMTVADLGRAMDDAARLLAATF